MRNVQKIPRPIRQGLKAIVPDRVRPRLHDWDYHAGQIAATYRHHVAMAPSASASVRFRMLLRTMCQLINRPCILFYPSLPDPGHIPYKLCLHLGYGLTDDPSGSYDAAIKWKDGTYVPNDSVIEDLRDTFHIINAGVTDISKGHVMEVFEGVFGYPLGVDPTSYEGPILRKSEINAAHDGTVIEGPLSEKDLPDASSAFVYQRLVDNIYDGLAKDLRVPVFGDEIPFVRVKYRPVDQRFDHAGRSQVGDALVAPEEVLSPTEQERILELCRGMGLDYGELDVLRDRLTDRIYVVDVNDTPTGPTFVSADPATVRWCFNQMSEAFSRCLSKQ
jgi:hypothetical protein